jgi:hypothetical protein
MATIFLSDRRMDTEVLQQVKQVLRNGGVSVRTDKGIEKKIEVCKGFVDLFSPDSFQSVWARWRKNRANRLKPTLFPVVIEDASIVLYSIGVGDYSACECDWKYGGHHSFRRCTDILAWLLMNSEFLEGFVIIDDAPDDEIGSVLDRRSKTD